MHEEVSLSMPIDFKHPVGGYVLVTGGWHSLAFAPAGILFIDKNILNDISHINSPPNRHDSQANKWWIQFLNTETHILNPVLCAIEGNTQTIPSFEQFKNSFDSACKTISTNLPKAKIISFDEDCYQAAYETIIESQERHLNESQFLVDAAPIISQRKKLGNKLNNAEKTLFSLCASNNLQPTSFVFLTALSCLYESKHGKEPLIGRKIINPSAQYTIKKAHNALSDLRALEYLAATNGSAYCTRDKHLAALWCALKFKKESLSNNQLNFKIQLDGQLFPRLSTSEINELCRRIEQASL